MVLKYIFVVLFGLFSLHCAGQGSVRVSGVVADAADKSALASATVSFQGKHPRATFTNADGRFSLDVVAGESYVMKVSYVGYESYKRNLTFTKSATLYVNLKANLRLSEVTVTAAAPAVLQKADRMIVRPEVYMLTAGKNAADVLRQLPGVIVDANGGISIVGKPAIVYINGKPADLTGTTVEQRLKTLQAERIERVELITNPSARYEAAHSGAIIDIRLRRDESMGFNGTASASYYLKTTGPAVEPSLSAN